MITKLIIRVSTIFFLAEALGCIANPVAKVTSIEFLKNKTTLRDYKGRNVTAMGYLSIGINSDTNLIDIATKYEANLGYTAITCDSHIELGVGYLYTDGPFSYSALVNYKDAGHKLNLVVKQEDICITVHIGSMNPLYNAHSNMIRLTVPDSFISEMRMYDNNNGVVFFERAPIQNNRR